MRNDPKFATFYSAYVNENVGSDIQNTFLEEEAEDQLDRLFAHTPAVLATSAPRETWVQGRDDETEIRELTEQIRTKYDQREKRTLEKYDLTEEEVFQLRVEAIDFQVALYDTRETVRCDCIRYGRRPSRPLTTISRAGNVSAARAPNSMPLTAWAMSVYNARNEH
ncbi:hypothetical protein DL764_010858 [Monosporascus ibericus]|uniref:Uncharacterized protein n=1 Tax=Monosporascus ibericus TaxID=155417 RepID=A0A4V1X8K4_9PEZI|nr:hypothetical protein DL764_010858 [Monosporascus ibericus]